ncbi:MAG: SCO family protein [Gemmatimonadaceae bacterium]|nr:SCO family protein [Gemmatimonadaceae bacterium]
MESIHRQRMAVAALAVILAITGAWWMLALWPTSSAAPEWVERTRLACFGAAPGGLPNSGGWLVMIGQPLGMIIVLVAAWGGDLRAGVARMTRHVSGQMAVGAVLAGIVAGVAGVAVRVSNADARPFIASTTEQLAAALTRVNDTVPTMRLADQHGNVLDLAAFRGKPVLVSFAFAHCETVCPLLVMDMLDAQKRIRAEAARVSPDATEAELDAVTPEVVVVTIDPFRDTPSRLPTIAKAWEFGKHAHVLSGPVDEVDLVLNAWRVPRVRNEATGDYTHPVMVYVIGRSGRIQFVTPGGADVITAAIQSL